MLSTPIAGRSRPSCTERSMPGLSTRTGSSGPPGSAQSAETTSHEHTINRREDITFTFFFEGLPDRRRRASFAKTFLLNRPFVKQDWLRRSRRGAGRALLYLALFSRRFPVETNQPRLSQRKNRMDRSTVRERGLSVPPTTGLNGRKIQHYAARPSRTSVRGASTRRPSIPERT
jgi:hypothetical protein